VGVISRYFNINFWAFYGLNRRISAYFTRVPQAAYKGETASIIESINLEGPPSSFFDHGGARRLDPRALSRPPLGVLLLVFLRGGRPEGDGQPLIGLLWKTYGVFFSGESRLDFLSQRL
jgi:hypothetical protein